MLIVGCDDATQAWYAAEKGVDQRGGGAGSAAGEAAAAAALAAWGAAQEAAHEELERELAVRRRSAASLRSRHGPHGGGGGARDEAATAAAAASIAAALMLGGSHDGDGRRGASGSAPASPAPGDAGSAWDTDEHGGGDDGEPRAPPDAAAAALDAAALADFSSRVPSLAAFAHRASALLTTLRPAAVTPLQWAHLLALLDVSVSRQLAARVFTALGGADAARAGRVPLASFQAALAMLEAAGV